MRGAERKTTSIVRGKMLSLLGNNAGWSKMLGGDSVRATNLVSERVHSLTEEWHPLTWFFSADHRRLVRSEMERITRYREKGDL